MRTSVVASPRSVLLALAPPALGVAVVWAVRPGVVENAVRSPVAWLVSAGVLAAALGVRAAAARLGAGPLLARGLSTVVVLALVVAVLAPSFRQRTLVEELPDELAAGPVATATASPAAPSQPAAAPVTAPTGAQPVAPTGASRPVPSTAVPAPAATASSSPRASAAAPPDLDLSGELQGIGHGARGTVRLQTRGGAAFLLFDDVDIEGTVGPSVHLVPEGRRTPGGGVRIGDLKAERGTFSYRLPASVDLTRRWSVLVWCDPYDTPIASADPR